MSSIPMTMEFLMHVDLKSWTPHFVKSSFFTLWHWASVRYIVTCIPMREFHGLLFLPIKSDSFCHFASPVGKIRRFSCKAKQPAAVLMAYDLGKELILRPCFNLKVQVLFQSRIRLQHASRVVQRREAPLLRLPIHMLAMDRYKCDRNW